MYYCCFCVPLQIGCLIIGALFIVFGGPYLAVDVKVLKFLEDEKYDDDENLDQKRRVRASYYFWICYEILLIATGVAIIIAAAKGCAFCLKVCACVVVALGVSPVVRLAIIRFETSTMSVVTTILTLVILLYCAYALWCYAERLDMDPDEEDEERVNPVANLFRGRPTTYSAQQYSYYPPSYPPAPSSYYPPGYHGPVGEIGGKTVHIAPPGHPGYPSPTGVSRGIPYGLQGVGYRSSTPSVYQNSSEDTNDPARPPGYPQGPPGYPGSSGGYHQGPPGYPGSSGGYHQGPPGYPGSSGGYPQGPYRGQPQAPYPGYPGPAAQGWNATPQQTSANTDPLQAARTLGIASMLNNFGRR